LVLVRDWYDDGEDTRDDVGDSGVSDVDGDGRGDSRAIVPLFGVRGVFGAAAAVAVGGFGVMAAVGRQ